MPQKKGAPARARNGATAPASGRARNGATALTSGRAKTGAPASGHGKKPAGAKKPRWTAEQRTAKGRTAERPRGGETPNRAERRARQFGETPAADASSRRPNWEPRGKASRSERPARRSDDRPARPARGPRGAEAPKRAPREASAERFVPAPDVVLEKLEATAIEASDATGAGFAELGLGGNIVRVLAELGAQEPFPIQAGTIPAVIAGRDVLGRGRTGSGKTIAFGAPLVERLLRLQAGSERRRAFGRAPRALILAPTRELALQIDATVQPIARSVGLFTTQIVGGVPFARQLGALDRGVDIVIGTPGRIQDLADRGKLELSEVLVTVLDEADHMAELGFLEPVQELLRLTPAGGQRLLFSATLDSGVGTLVDEFLVDPAVFEVAGEDQASGTIEHRVLLIDHRDKLAVLTELVTGRDRSLVFARTRSFAEQLAEQLDDAGIDADAIHGDLTQGRRQRALDRFARGRSRVLVATDVAARGIHVDDVDLVVQADAPDEYKAYLHRSGRTGRAGKAGTVVTLVPRNRRRRMEELLSRAEIVAEWLPYRSAEAGVSSSR